MKKLNTIFQPLALQSYSPFAKAEASCTHASCVNALRCAWAYNIMMTRSIMQRYSNKVVRQNTVRCITSSATKSINTTQKRFCSATVMQNTVFNHTNNKVVWQNTVTNHTDNKIVWKNIRTRNTKQLVRCRNDTTAACCTIVHLKRCMPTAWVGASAI